MSDARDDDDERVLSVHYGRSANCSSIGSVVDVLFVSGVAGTAVLASLAVLLGKREAAVSAVDRGAVDGGAVESGAVDRNAVDSSAPSDEST